MNAPELVGLIDLRLGALAHKSGTVFYSGLDTLEKGDFYVVGLNPGGAPANSPTTIRSTVPHVANWSAYTQDCWRKDCDGECVHKDGDRVSKHSLVKHQRYVLTLFNALGRDPEDVFSTNCVFARSGSAKTFKQDTGKTLGDWEATCWPVHQAFLNIVRPKWIISLGYGAATSAFGRWRRRLAKSSEWEQVAEGRRGGWTYSANFDLGEGRDPLETRVLGVPHPSYLEIGQDLEHFIRQHVAKMT